MKMISLKDPNGRVTFVRNLYNLHYALEEDPNTKASVNDLSGLIKRLNVKSLYTEVGRKKESTNEGLCTGSDGDTADGGGGSNTMPLQLSLRAHAFEVKLEEVIDDQGILWEPIKVQLFRSCCLP